ncbi:MAG: DUF4111 domain-containing protein, partial [Clostridia bacterium]|nr:DUF4111 domain-containing protein [Clostridia bacterium]
MDFVGLMCSRICEYLSGFDPSVYIYGSYCCEDYRDGWSDIDILVLTGKPLDRPTADRLLGLRKTLFSQYPDMPQLLTFEGGFTDAAAFFSGGTGLSVYWGTSKERLTEGYSLDCFGTKQLLENGILFCGTDHRDKIKMPDYEALCRGIRRHCDTVRTYVTTTGRSLYSFGWMLDISRCIYTLKTGELIPKTKAAEWALEKGICPVEEALRLSLGVRRNPEAALNSA